MALNISKKTSPADVDSSAKGDIIINSGTDVVALPVGTDGQIIVADSNSIEGIKWSADKPAVAEPALLDNEITTTWTTNSNSGSGADDLFDALYAQNGNTNGNGILFTIGSTLGATNYGFLTDTLSTAGSYGFTNGDPIFIDLLAGNTLSCNYASISSPFNGNSVTFSLSGSNDGTNWTALGTFASGSSSTKSLSVSDNTPFRYFRFITVGNNWNLGEVNLFGLYVSGIPIRSLQPIDLNKINYLLVGPGSTYQLSIPNSTGQWTQGDYFTFVNTGTGNANITLGGNVTLFGDNNNLYNFTLVNIDGADNWLLIKDEGFYTFPNNKGDLLTNDGSEVINVPVGSDGQVLLANSTTSEGIEWGALGGLNLTEVKIPTISTIDKTYPGSGNFTSDIPGAIDFIGRGELDPPNPYTDPEGTGVNFIVNGLTGTYLLADKDYGINTASVSGIGNSIVIDFLTEGYVNPTHIGYRGFNSPRNYNIEGSNNASTWDLLGSFATNANSTGNIITLNTTSNFYRYIRLQQVVGSGPTGFSEVEVYGNIVPSTPNYTLQDEDNNKFLIVPFGNPSTINVPDNLNDSGFITQITPTVPTALPITISPSGTTTFIGANFTIDNMGEIATIVQIDQTTYVVAISRGKLPLNTKGDLLVHDGNESIAQAVGANDTVLTADSAEASGVAWKDINTIVSTPFTAQSLDLTGTLQLTGSNARYLYLDPQGNTYDVILTDPPSANDFFYIVNRTGNGILQIKEIAAGGVIQILNSATPIAQCHYDNTGTWQVLTFGTI